MADSFLLKIMMKFEGVILNALVASSWRASFRMEVKGICEIIPGIRFFFLLAFPKD